MASATLRIRLLGELDLRRDEVAVPPLGSARAESLLAYLLLHREAPQPRQRLAFLLWPDSSDPQARTNLRHLLHNLRRALPDPDRFLEVTQRTLRWRDDAAWWLDVAAFEDAVARAGQAGQAVPALQEAVELYGGDLLQSSYDEWLLEERERLRRRYLEALERLAELLEAGREHARAIGYAERLLREDPLREATYRLLMRLHDARGDRARALRTYHACAATLERELSVEPSAATRRAYAALLPPSAEPATEPAAGRTGPLGRPPLVGRDAQRARLTGLWRAAESGGAQLVLVTGEPGAGKTRLVEEFSSWCASRGAATSQARSYPAEGALAYGPVVAWLRSDALAGHLGRLDPARREELARLLPELRPAAPGRPAPAPPPDRDQRRLLFEALAGAVLASPGPLLLVADDLHWADRETLQFLHYLLRAAAAGPAAGGGDRPAARSSTPTHPLHDLLTGLRALDRCRRGRGRAVLGPGDGGPGRAAAPAAARRRRGRAAVRRDRGQPAVRGRGPARRLERAGPARPGHPEGPGGDRGPPRPSCRARPATWPGWPRPSGGSSAPTCSPRPARPARRPWSAGWTSCGGAAWSATRAPTPTTSATTGSGRSPTSASARPGAATPTCSSPGRWSGCTPAIPSRWPPRWPPTTSGPARSPRRSPGTSAPPRRPSGCHAYDEAVRLLDRALRLLRRPAPVPGPTGSASWPS